MSEPASGSAGPTAASPDDPSPAADGPGSGRRRRITAAVIGLVMAAVLGTVGFLWQQSLVPDTYSVMDMGVLDYGGGPVPTEPMVHPGSDSDQDAAMAGHADMAGQADLAKTQTAPPGAGSAVSVTSLVGPDRPADVEITLVARAETIELTGDDGRSVDGFTLNHVSPGPQITVRQGQLLEVRLVNESVAGGVALHWHGVDVPNGEDGVAGVTQDAVGPGEEYLYRFVAEDAGTYWYHSHQVADVQVAKGLFGALVVEPAASGDPAAVQDDRGALGPLTDTVAIVHTYGGARTVNGVAGTARFEASPGDDVRVRLINTNNGPLRTWVTGSPYTLLALDGRDLHEPGPVDGQALVVAAGGRADLLVHVPADGTAVGVNVGGGAALAVGPSDGAVVGGADPHHDLDLLAYGTPAPLGFDPAAADRHFEYRIGRRIGFMDGRPGFWWTVNGGVYPDIPMYVVEEGDIAVMTITNNSGEVHPMHLHGHHAVVLSRDGKPGTGSPLWVDSLDIQDGQTYDIAFVADNPGLWMDHCHNLPHASQGLVAHLMYAGVTTPFMVGGDHDNDPE